MTGLSRFIWSEYVAYETLRASEVLGALGRRQIALVVAVRPGTGSEVAHVVRACRDAGVRVAVWPMLDNAEGRWASAANAERFCAYVRELLAMLAAERALPDAVAIDLEPPIERMQRILHGELRGYILPPDRARSRAAARVLGALAGDIAGMGMATLAAVIPPVVVGSRAARRGWQALLETPVDSLPLSHLSAMAYASLMEGYSRGFLRRRDVLPLVAMVAAEARAAHGLRAGVSLGAVGTGALGDEAVYRSAAELAQEVALVRAAGVDAIGLFNLDGVLARAPWEPWLDALVHTRPAAAMPAWTGRALAARAALAAIGHVSRLALGQGRSAP